MGKDAVLVFVFPEPEDHFLLGTIISNAKGVFLDIPDVKIKMAVNDTAKAIINILEPDDKGETNEQFG